MKYTDLQRRLKQYQFAGLVTVKLNSSLSVLDVEYRRCLKFGLSQTDQRSGKPRRFTAGNLTSND